MVVRPAATAIRRHCKLPLARHAMMAIRVREVRAEDMIDLCYNRSAPSIVRLLPSFHCSSNSTQIYTGSVDGTGVGSL